MSGARISSETNDPVRRLHPRMIDSDWLVMRGMAREIGALAQRLGRPGAVVVDFGCGNMPYKPLFEAVGCRYLGADFEGAADIAIDPSGRMDLADASADVVVSFQVLEHVRDLDTYFAEARRVLKPGGALLLSTHGVWLYHPHPEDHRRWTREGLVGDIERFGFAVSDCAPVVGPLGWTLILRLTGYCYVLKRLPLIGGLLAGAVALAMNARAFVEERVTPEWIVRDNACVYVTLSRPTPSFPASPA
ncbi:MAG TPA: class I SAM-dependent methyltransferase [Caulobacteraceae bacterium]|nr:class I SAM-dependent methyltransferase [Caulobacteraceae bacterium]